MSGPKYPKVVGFTLIKQIGGGAFSTVFEAVNFDDHRVAACKVVLITESTTEKDRKNVEKEMRVHSAFKHQHVLEFLNAVVVEMKHKAVYIPGIYMLVEYAGGGDLFDKIAPDVGVDEDMAHYYFLQLISGMHHIHSQGVCHRDLKPENLLLDAAGNLKITDFGLSSVFRLKDTGKTRMLTERCGSLPYVAPELNGDAPYHAEPIDVWGIGVILFTLMAGNTPWDEPTGNSPEFVRYVNGTIFTELPWNRIPSLALSLISGMLTIDPAERMSLDDVFQHSWCIRPSQLAGQSPMDIADRLIAAIRESGDLRVAAPDISNNMDVDEDETMHPATYQSQFTRSLMLFSQTQSGTRYTPHLTRFYASVGPALLTGFIQEFLESRNVQCKPMPRGTNERGVEMGSKLRIGGKDGRREIFKGWVEVEGFARNGMEGSFCLMRKDMGNPLSWKQLWKEMVQSDIIGPHVLRK